MTGLPPLRQEIRIDRGAALVNGAPSWTLFDPVRHSYYQLGRIEFQIFSHWAQGRLGKLGKALAAEGVPEDQMDAELARVLDFSLAHNLTQTPLTIVVVGILGAVTVRGRPSHHAHDLRPFGIKQM